MAMVTSVRIESHVDEINEELKTKIEDWLEVIGEDAAGTAAGIPNFPVDTGRLKNSINWATAHANGSGDQPLATPEENSVYIGTNVEYAVYHELGTSRGIPAKHFIQFGATAHQAEYKRRLEEVLKS